MFLLQLTSYLEASEVVVFKKYAINVGNGKSVWLTVRFDNSIECYALTMGGDYSATATTCGSINGHWAYNACGKSRKWVDGGINEVANKILEECRN